MAFALLGLELAIGALGMSATIGIDHAARTTLGLPKRNQAQFEDLLNAASDGAGFKAGDGAGGDTSDFHKNVFDCPDAIKKKLESSDGLKAFDAKLKSTEGEDMVKAYHLALKKTNKAKIQDLNKYREEEEQRDAVFRDTIVHWNDSIEEIMKKLGQN
ncbi:hypothetical protein FRC09_007573 [Ceratobasidium sp. 395]|nr:hypothetical protein FRC09_007573 [Ceratobasidium sp. 395]